MDSAGGKRLDDVADESGRHDGGTIAFAADVDAEPDGQLEVGTGDGERVTFDLHADAGQDRQRARPVRRRPSS